MRRRCSASRSRCSKYQVHAVVITAPDELRARLRALPLAELVWIAAAFRPLRTGAALATPMAAAKLALKGLAIRYRQLSAEIHALDVHLEQLVAVAAPELVAVKGVGTDIAGALLVAAGDNPDRLHSEAAFASLCGVAPIPASSGKTNRHRLSRGGDRDANRALYPSPWGAWAGIPPPAPTSRGAPPRDSPSPRSSGA
jgi:transposase